jgi:hypothetical protein
MASTAQRNPRRQKAASSLKTWQTMASKRSRDGCFQRCKYRARAFF